MLTKLFLLLIVLFHSSTAVIYHLNESDYALMPPLFLLDNYEECFRDPEGLYCFAEFALVSDDSSSLLTMIQEYSAHIRTHYNHTLLRCGKCIKQTCKKSYEIAKGDLGSALEACVNESLYKKYKLKARMSNGFDCSKRDKHPPIDYVDITVAVICVIILMANLIGSLCNMFLEKRVDHGGIQYLYCFSIFRNWKKLIASPTKSPEHRLQKLRGIHGIRVMNTSCVIICHSFITGVILTANPEFLESMYHFKIFHLFLNGTLVMQSFLIISSFLLVYNWLINLEKHEISWKMLPKQVIMRWLRLTPSYAIILALTATWFGRIASGPYWKKYISGEMTDCRRDWWKHLLYINNYFDGSECMPQSWYLATDTQLYYMGVIIFLLCRTTRTRKVVLSLLFIVGLIVPALHTYYQHLDGILIISPESALTQFQYHPTYDKVYKRGHTNVIGYVIGMAMGYMFYDWQKTGGDPKNFWKYRFLFWSLFPLSCLCFFSGGVFFMNMELPTYVHLLFAALMKPIFAIIVGTIMAGVIIQFEGLYRSVLEWRAWTLPSRLSFSAYLLHVVIVRNTVAMQTNTQRTEVFGMILQVYKILLNSFIAAFFFWMLVEAPFGNLVKACFVKPELSGQEENEEKTDQDVTNIKNENARDKNLTQIEVTSIVINKTAM